MCNDKFREAIARIGTQAEAAGVLQTSQAALSRLINGDYGLSHKIILRLCTLLNLSYLPEDLDPDEDWDWLYDFIDKYKRKKK